MVGQGESAACLRRSGRGPTWERSLLASPGVAAPVPAWGQKSQRHLTNCVSSISSEKDHSKFNRGFVQGKTSNELSPDRGRRAGFNNL